MSAVRELDLTRAGYYRDIRKALHLNQADFGALLNAHSVTVSKWERGRAKPDRYQQAVMASFQTAIDSDAPIRPDLDALIASCGPIYTLYVLLNQAHGVR